MFGTRENVEIVRGDILALNPGALMGATDDERRTTDDQRPTTNDQRLSPASVRPSSSVLRPSSSVVRHPPYKVVANLPYYITNVVVRHLLEASPPPALTVVMVQEEVAERICAEPGDMSILSVSVQFYAEPSIAFRVPADAFYPRPNVDSAVLRLESRIHPAIASADGITPAVDVKRFFAMVRAGFSQKRKQLRNSLSGGLHLPKKTVDAALRAADIDPSRRAQTLSLFEWARLYQTLEGIG
jgi:16S rRNA (adenine1518-N6/adenine1519-N6)-dimethyltransferase